MEKQEEEKQEEEMEEGLREFEKRGTETDERKWRYATRQN